MSGNIYAFSHFYKIQRLDTRIDDYGIFCINFCFICKDIELNAGISFDTFEIFVRDLGMSNSFISITYSNKIRLHIECHVYMKRR